jgi:hypothetical protein
LVKQFPTLLRVPLSCRVLGQALGLRDPNKGLVAQISLSPKAVRLTDQLLGLASDRALLLAGALPPLRPLDAVREGGAKGAGVVDPLFALHLLDALRDLVLHVARERVPELRSRSLVPALRERLPLLRRPTKVASGESCDSLAVHRRPPCLPTASHRTNIGLGAVAPMPRKRGLTPRSAGPMLAGS